MRGYDPDGFTLNHSSDDTQTPAGFLMVTITRALCNNFHSRLGSPSKQATLNKVQKLLNVIVDEVMGFYLQNSKTTIDKLKLNLSSYFYNPLQQT